MAKYPRSAATGTSMRERCADRDENASTTKTAEELEEEKERRRDEARTRPSTRVEIRGEVPAERGHGHLDARANAPIAMKAQTRRRRPEN